MLKPELPNLKIHKKIAPLKNMGTKMIFELYQSLISPGQLEPGSAPKPADSQVLYKIFYRL